MAKARPKFSAPREQLTSSPDVPEGPPPVVEPCAYLREIKTGRVHPYTAAMAQRGDLVEAYDGEPPTPDEERAVALIDRGIIDAAPVTPKLRSRAVVDPLPPVLKAHEAVATTA